MERVILHSDLNNFYASVECLYQPSLRDKPVAVCGDTEARHGIVLAKNQIAKKLGVKTGDAIWQAKQKCPDLVTIPPDFDKYLKFSKIAKEIYGEYTDQTESFGIDEAWLDVTGSRIFGEGTHIADTIRIRIAKELGITASIGVSYSKIFAKLGSDMKKPDATTIITKDNYKDIVWPLPASDLLYVGKATTDKLHRMGVDTIGQLAGAQEEHLAHALGKWGLVLRRFANGWDHSPVMRNGDESVIKSVGNSTTLPRDLTTTAEVKAVVYLLADSVAARLRAHKLKCTGVQISIRDNALFSCERQAKLTYPSYLCSEITDKAMEIFETRYQFRAPIRSIGVRGINLIPEDTPVQLSIFEDVAQRDRMEALEHTMDDIRRRYGHHALRQGILLFDDTLTGINPKDEHIIHPYSYFNGAIL